MSANPEVIEAPAAAPTAAEQQPAPESPGDKQNVEQAPETPEAKAAREEETHRRSKTDVERRIAKITRLGREAETRAAQAEQRAREAEQRIAAIEARQSGQETEPKLEDFETYAEFTREAARFAARQAVKEATKGQQQQPQGPQHDPNEAHAQRIRAEIVARTQDVIAQAVQKYPDLATLAPPDELPDFSQENATALAAILSSEMAPDVLNHIYRNPEVAWKLAALPPAQAFKEIGRIEATLGGSTTRISGAPAPAQRLKGNAGGSKKPEDMSMAEYTAYMESKERKRS